MIEPIRDPWAPLSARDRERLSLWKWAYALQGGSYGEHFTVMESRRLVFMAWRRDKQNAYQDDRAPAEGA